MDIFGRKRIAALEEEVVTLKRSNYTLKNDLQKVLDENTKLDEENKRVSSSLLVAQSNMRKAVELIREFSAARIPSGDLRERAKQFIEKL